MEKEKTIKIEYKRVVDEFNFWKLYFHTWNFNKPKHERFSEFELDSIACIMSGDYYKSPVKSSQRKQLADKLGTLGYKLTGNNVHTRVIVPLLKAGIFYKSEDDLVNGEYSINAQLKKLQGYIKTKLKEKGEIPLDILYSIMIKK